MYADVHGRNGFRGTCKPTVLAALCSYIPRLVRSDRAPPAPGLYLRCSQQGQPLSFLGGRPPYTSPASSTWPLSVALEDVSVALGCRLALQLVQWLWTTARSPATIPR